MTIREAKIARARQNNADKILKKDRVRLGRCRQCGRRRGTSPSKSRCRLCLKVAREDQKRRDADAVKS